MRSSLVKLGAGLAFAASLLVALVAAADVPMPVSVPAKGEQCVEPTDEMRRNHMGMLMHQRDDTVISGIRTPKHSLVGCIECHAQKDDSGEYVPVNAEGQFCSTCHEYAAVEIDCFSCHATVPAIDGTAQFDDMLDSHGLASGSDRPFERLPSMRSENVVR